MRSGGAAQPGKDRPARNGCPQEPGRTDAHGDRPGAAHEGRSTPWPTSRRGARRHVALRATCRASTPRSSRGGQGRRTRRPTSPRLAARSGGSKLTDCVRAAVVTESSRLERQRPEERSAEYDQAKSHSPSLRSSHRPAANTAYRARREQRPLRGEGEHRGRGRRRPDREKRADRADRSDRCHGSDRTDRGNRTLTRDREDRVGRVQRPARFHASIVAAVSREPRPVGAFGGDTAAVYGPHHRTSGSGAGCRPPGRRLGLPDSMGVERLDLVRHMLVVARVSTAAAETRNIEATSWISTGAAVQRVPFRSRALAGWGSGGPE